MSIQSRRRSVLAAVTVLVLAAAGPVWAAARIQNVEGSPIPAGLSAEQIDKAMKAGGATRGWIVKSMGAGHLEATIFVRSHMAQVDIRYADGSYSITYKDSQNLGYANGKIHRNYNKWVQNLNMDIQRAFAML